MSSVLLKAGCFFVIILMGYSLKKIGLLSQTDLPVFSKLVTKITLPAAIVHNFSQATMDISMLVIVVNAESRIENLVATIPVVNSTTTSVPSTP